jgi:predicted aspartyl protease
MKANYKNNMPVMKLKVFGPKGMKEYDAYLDTGAGRSLIPEKDAIDLGLPYAGDTTIITGTGKDSIKLYRAKVSFLNRKFLILVFGRDLPEQALVKAMIGRDVLDNFKVCFDSIRREVEII